MRSFHLLLGGCALSAAMFVVGCGMYTAVASPGASTVATAPDTPAGDEVTVAVSDQGAKGSTPDQAEGAAETPLAEVTQPAAEGGDSSPEAVQQITVVGPMPTSGSEPAFAPAQWNTPRFQWGNNCYAYACNDADGFRRNSFDFPQPGNVSGVGPADPIEATYEVRALRDRAVADGLTPAPPGAEDSPAPQGFYKVALFVAPGLDYHWYRQDPDGFWSHKLADGPVEDLDAAHRRIADPRYANRNYDRSINPATGEPFGHNYAAFGGFFYVPEGGIPLRTVIGFLRWQPRH